ncbi:hypothetical protein [Conexibacter arvalis]|uniref:Uncharacterized protein n=1 Tax=Conexibacter arvalis TaxID=912552 RepID=A0A840IEF8_9ACTN|nr:hypothetical protein [Conexibacter arvalis]MBB4662398.1 hypothetical protein [Conexibacter arvalis]
MAAVDRPPERPAPAPARRQPLLELPAAATAAVGSRAGLRAALAATVLLAAIGETAASRTAVTGIRSSTWTAITAPAALVFGPDAFHGDFHLGAIAAGLALLLLGGALLGVPGAALVVLCLGARPARGLASAIGVAYGLALQLVLVNVLANGLQDDDLLSRSLPTWGWWAAFALYGLVLGLASARLAERRADARAAAVEAHAAGAAR